MGLDISHDCWSASYSAFSRWRTELTKAAGYKTRPSDYGSEILDIDWNRFEDKNLQGEWDSMPDDPLMILIIHSDCDGIIPAQYTNHLANRLTQLLPNLRETGEGHLQRIGIRGATERFIKGLELASSCNEDVEFS